MKQKISNPFILTVFRDLIKKQLRKEILKGRPKRRKEKKSCDKEDDSCRGKRRV